MSEEIIAKAGASASMTAVKGSQRVIAAELPYKASIEGVVFRAWFPGRKIFNPETGREEDCLRDEVSKEGVIGHHYNHGVLCHAASLAGAEKMVRQIKRRIWWAQFKTKLFTKFKGFLNGL